MKTQAMIMLLASFGKRLFDKDSPKTTIGTISGTTMIAIGATMLDMPEPIFMIGGGLLCAAGVGLIWYKEYKGIDGEPETIEEEAKK